RRAFLVAGGDLRAGADQALQVVGLEVVGAAGAPAGEVEHRVEDRAAGVDVGGGQGDGRGPAAGAAAAQGEPVAVGGALGGEGQRDGGAVLHVDHAPLLTEPVAVRAPVSGGAAVVDLGDADAARGEVGDLQVQDERHPAGRAAVRADDIGRQPVAGRGAAGVVRGVDAGVDLAAVGAGEGAAQGLGVVGRVHDVVVLGADDAGPAGAGVQLHDLGGAARTARHGDDAFAVGGEEGRVLRPGAGRVDDLAGLGVEDAERRGAPAVQDGDEAVVERGEPAPSRPPQRAAELLLARADRFSVAVEVPPAGAVAAVQQPSVGGPVGLGDGLLRSARHGPGFAEGAVGGDVGDEELGAVPRHARVVPGQPGHPPPVGCEPRAGDEPVPAVGEFAYRTAVV